MDLLGFFDGLLSAFSAARSGKNIDEQKSSTAKLNDKKNKQQGASLIQSNKDKIKNAREKQSKNKQYEKDIR